MKNIFAVIILCLTVFCFTSCKSNITDPPPVEIEPGRRDYVWTEYILDFPPNEIGTLWSLWGANPNDLWAVGDCGLSQLGVWHFNGIVWQNASPTPTCAQQSIWGSATNDIWIGSGSGQLWRFNGSEWNYYAALKSANNKSFAVQAIWGISKNEVYAVGSKLPNDTDGTVVGSVIKYDGSSWKRINIPDNNLNFYDVMKDRNGDLIISAMDNYTFRESVLVWNESELKEFFSPVPFGKTSMTYWKGSVYFQREEKLYKYENGEFRLFKDFSGLELTLIKCMRNEKDIIFAYKKESTVGLAHYNGTDINYIYTTTSNYSITSCMIYEKDVIFLLTDFRNAKTKVVHGKLLE